MNEMLIKRPLLASKTELMLPASKSISNRLLVMRFLSVGKVQIIDPSTANDTQLMQALLDKVEKKIAEKENSECVLDCKNAGTVFRFLTALLALQPGNWHLTGSDRMKERPIAALVDALRQIGANIDYLETEGYPPVLIKGKPIPGGRVALDASKSSQYISALMMIAPLMQNGLEIELMGHIASKPYIDMTIDLMQQSGIEVFTECNDIRIGHSDYKTHTFSVEHDWSSASYWYEVVALIPGMEILLNGLSSKSIQGDKVLARIFYSLGIGSHETKDGIMIKRFAEPAVKLIWDLSDYPDLAPAIAATCTALNVEAELTGLQNLRIKESDRLYSLKTELNKINPLIEIIGTGTLLIRKQKLPGKYSSPIFNTYHDHRMAMALAPIAAICDQVIIENPQVVEKSYPHFWMDLAKTGFVLMK